MRRTKILLVAALLMGAGACSKTSSDDVTTAAQIADEIQANPANADKILADHKMSRDDYQNLILEIAKDSTKAAQYAAARKSK